MLRSGCGALWGFAVVVIGLASGPVAVVVVLLHVEGGVPLIG